MKFTLHETVVHFFFLSIWIRSCRAAPDLQQTVPPGGVAVCPHSTFEFTCVGETELQWRDMDTPMTVTFDTSSSSVNQADTTGVFRTVLTDISSNTLTSTATIVSVQLEHNGKRIACRDITGLANQHVGTVQVKAIPLSPSKLKVTAITEMLGKADTSTESSVNLTWTLDSQCVVVYHVEVTNTNTSNITNVNTTSQYIVLTLQTGVVYSFRVRGADSAGRGEWSELFMYTTVVISGSTVYIFETTSPTATDTESSNSFQWSTVVFVVIILLLLAILTTVIVCVILAKMKTCKRGADQGQLKPSTIHAPTGEQLYEDIDDTGTDTNVDVSKNLAYEFSFDHDQQASSSWTIRDDGKSTKVNSDISSNPAYGISMVFSQ